MSDDKAVHARAAGKARIREQIIWSLTLGDLELRCLKPRDGNGYEVEANSEDGWIFVVTGSDPLTLIRQAIMLPSCQLALARKIAALPT